MEGNASTKSLQKAGWVTGRAQARGTCRARRTHGAAFSEGRGSRGWRQRFSLFVAEYAQKGTHYFILSMSSRTCCGLGTMLDEGHAVMDKNVEAPVPTEVRTEEKRIGSCLDLRLGVQEAFT